MIDEKPTKVMSAWKLAPVDIYTSYNPLNDDGSSNSVDWVSIFLSAKPIDKEEKCNLCLSTDNQESMQTFSCNANHIYHQNCLEVTHTHGCPLCRT